MRYRYYTSDEIDAMMRFPWRAMVAGLFLGLACGAVAVGLVLVLV